MFARNPVLAVLLSLLCLLLLLCLAGFLFTAYKTASIRTAYPNLGERIDIGGYAMNSVLIPAAVNADLPPLVFVHGASGNLRDQLFAFSKPLQGRAEMLYVDRPGFGYSDRGGPENGFPDGQADAIAAVMDKRGMKKAIIVGHSFGGAVVATFALRHPDKVLGLVFLSPATHPWPGGIAWYNSAAKMPYVGWLLTHIVTLPVGLTLLDAGTKSVFAPNHRPDDYVANTAPGLLLQPSVFRANATDIANLLDYTKKVSPLYNQITAPTVIITGDADNVVSPVLHSQALHRAIAGSQLVTVHNMGHKSDYVANDLAIEAIETLAGIPHDLQLTARRVDARLVNDHE